MAERARLIAEQIEGDIHLLHAIEPAPEALIAEPVVALMRRHVEESAGEIADWLRSRTDRPVSLQTVKGSASWEIVRASKRAQLTVVGSSSVDVARTGPVARRVAETSRGHVLIVKRQPRVPYRKVIVGTDLSEASRHAVETALRVAPEAEIWLVFALPTRFDSIMAEAGMFPEEIEASRQGRLKAASEKMEAFAAEWGDRVRATVADGPPLELIEETIRRRSADLAVVASRGAGATRMVLLGTVASGLLDAVPCDVCVARVPGDFRRP